MMRYIQNQASATTAHPPSTSQVFDRPDDDTLPNRVEDPVRREKLATSSEEQKRGRTDGLEASASALIVRSISCQTLITPTHIQASWLPAPTMASPLPASLRSAAHSSAAASTSAQTEPRTHQQLDQHLVPSSIIARLLHVPEQVVPSTHRAVY